MAAPVWPFLSHSNYTALDQMISRSQRLIGSHLPSHRSHCFHWLCLALEAIVTLFLNNRSIWQSDAALSLSPSCFQLLWLGTDDGNEGLVYGLLTTISNLGSPFGRALANQIFANFAGEISSLCPSTSHSYTHTHSLSLVFVCCYDLTKGTQDKDFSYSFSDSFSASLCTSHTHYHLYLLLWWNQRNSRPRSVLTLILWFSLSSLCCCCCCCWERRNSRPQDLFSSCFSPWFSLFLI